MPPHTVPQIFMDLSVSWTHLTVRHNITCSTFATSVVSSTMMVKNGVLWIDWEISYKTRKAITFTISFTCLLKCTYWFSASSNQEAFNHLQHEDEVVWWSCCLLSHHGMEVFVELECVHSRVLSRNIFIVCSSLMWAVWLAFHQHQSMLKAALLSWRWISCVTGYFLVLQTR